MDIQNAFFSSIKRINQNALLHSEDKGLEFNKFMMLKEVADLDKEKGLTDKELNLSKISNDEINWVFQMYGETGLQQLMMLSMTTNEFDFNHFTNILKGLPLADALSSFKSIEDLKLENDILPQSKILDRFNHNVLQPSLSRKLYRTGIHHGSFVYGFGGPRILISHPFRGIKGDIYGMYENTIDVVTSLLLRGYRGMFHFLDYLNGLNGEIDGVPKWALWFSIIANHSDMVIYIKQHEGDFGPAQKLEIELTSNRVQKKIVEIPHSELKWAKDPEVEEGIERIYVGEKGIVSEEEWMSMESSHSAPFIENYVSGGFPRDRLITISENGRVNEYPSNYLLYR